MKPTFEEVFSAFQYYQNAMIRAVNRTANIPGATPTDLQAECSLLQIRIRERFRELGLEEHINWEDKENHNGTS